MTLRHWIAAWVAGAGICWPALCWAEDDPFFGQGSWFMVAPEYGMRVAPDHPGPDEESSPDGMDHQAQNVSVTQSHFALAFRGVFWSDSNVTLQGHRAGLNLQFHLGWAGEDSYRDETGSLADRDIENGGGGVIFGFRSHFPWTIVESSSFRWGVGLGFGSLYELGRTFPGAGEWAMLGLDVDLGTTLELELSDELFVSTSYEYAPFALYANAEHRGRLFVIYDWFGIGAEVKYGYNEFSRAGIADTASYFQGSLNIGYVWRADDD